MNFFVLSLIKSAVVAFVLMTTLAYLQWIERKVIAHIQLRVGPRRVGPHGLLQPLADVIKLLTKEDLLPSHVNKVFYFLAPFIAVFFALIAISVIPFGTEIHVGSFTTEMQLTDLNIGVLFILGLSGMGVYGVALAGWASNNKYALLGGLRSSAQMISYEVSLTLSVVGVLLIAGTLNFNSIISGQSGYYFHFIPRWHVIPQLIGFLCYITAAIAETNRIPFDLPEAETELVAGFHTEYSSFKFAMFFMAEYANMITVSCLATILFFGGWLSPFPDSWAWPLFLPGAGLVLLGMYCAWDTVVNMRGIAQLQFAVVTLLCLVGGAICLMPGVREVIQGPFWFTTKVIAFLFFYVWTRGTLPRFRYDQLMDFGWKLLLPVSLANLVVTSFVMIVPYLRHG